MCPDGRHGTLYLYALFFSFLFHITILAALQSLERASPQRDSVSVQLVDPTLFTDSNRLQAIQKPLKGTIGNPWVTDIRPKAPTRLFPNLPPKTDIIPLNLAPTVNADSQGGPPLSEQGNELTPTPLQDVPGLPFSDTKQLDRLAKLLFETTRPPKDVISINTEELKYFSYLLKVKSSIEYIWKYPEIAAVMGMEGELLLNFNIDREGHVRNVEIITTSGYDLLDQEAIRAVRTAAPLPPLPKSWNEEQITINGRFVYHNHYTYIR